MLACCCPEVEPKAADGGAATTLGTAEDEEVVKPYIVEADAHPAMVEPASAPISEEVKETKATEKRSFVSAEFTIKLEKTGNEALSLQIDALDKKVMQVCDIGKGLVATYNDQHPEEQVQLGDFIVSVNGVNESPDAMKERLKLDSKLEIGIRRSKPWQVTLGQNAKQLLPCMEYLDNGTSLLITSTDDDTFQKWNALHPDLDVCKHDRILCINNLEGAPPKKMIEEVKNSSVLTMLIARPVF